MKIVLKMFFTSTYPLQNVFKNNLLVKGFAEKCQGPFLHSGPDLRDVACPFSRSLLAHKCSWMAARVAWTKNRPTSVPQAILGDGWRELLLTKMCNENPFSVRDDLEQPRSANFYF